MTARAPQDATEALLEAIARAVGARAASLLPPDAPVPAAQRSSFLRREESHPLVVGLPRDDRRRLLLTFDRPPTLEDELIARSLVRSLERPERRRGSADPSAVIAAAARSPEERPAALLQAACRTVRARAGGLALTFGGEPQLWTHGPGRPVLQAAAMEAATGGRGRIEVLGRTFLVRRLAHHGRTIGGIAFETTTETTELQGCVEVVASVLAPPPPRPTDVADRRERSGEELASVVAAIPVPVLAFDGEGKLVAASPEAEAVFGLTDFDLGTHPDHRLAAIAVERTLSGGPTVEEVHAGGRWWDVSSASISGGGRVFVLEDRGQEAARLSSQDRLVSSMSHELRTPIAAVKALLELHRMAGAKLTPEKLVELAGEGLIEVTRLERLVEDLLLVARIATGGIHARPDTIALRPVVDEVIRHLGTRHPRHTFRADGEALAFADPALVRHMVWHLLDNAAKFTEPDEPVDVEVTDEPAVRVTDRGPGIYSGDLDQLFKPFRRLEKRGTTQHGGAGVGLYLVRSIAEANAGSIDVESRLGKGSTFTVRLPRAPTG